MDVEVETHLGRIIGLERDGVIQFRGIPYAEAPIGDLRWKPPRMKITLDRDTFDARNFGSICPQPRFELVEGTFIEERQSEDCLFLNVYTPSLDDKKMPVMVFFHGGAFVYGSSSHPLYRKGKLCKYGVVLVTLNYRLGPFGFLRLKDLGDRSLQSSGNEGLLDQLCALKWIKENISFFGGDPDNITLFGESAGAISILCLMAMEEKENLFHKVIIQSGNPDAVFEKEKSNYYAKKFIEVLGIGEKDIMKLKELSAEKLVEAEEKLLNESDEITCFSPNVDGEIIKRKPSEPSFSGRKLPLLIGTNSEEWNIFSVFDKKIRGMDFDELNAKISARVKGLDARKVIDFYREKLRKEKKEPEAWRIYSEFMTHTFFLIPSLKFAERWASFGNPVFVYLFTWSSPYLSGILGACHTLELGFIFGNYDERFFGSGKKANELSEKMQDSWTSFAKTSDPSCESLGIWESYGSSRNIMVLGERCYLTRDPYGDLLSLYEGS